MFGRQLAEVCGTMHRAVAKRSTPFRVKGVALAFSQWPESVILTESQLSLQVQWLLKVPTCDVDQNEARHACPSVLGVTAG